MQAELEALDKALGTPERPVAAIVGGAKVSTKLDLLGNLVGKVDKLIIGGGMANTFLDAQGIKVGKSLCEKDLGRPRARSSPRRRRQVRDPAAGRRRGRARVRGARAVARRAVDERRPRRHDPRCRPAHASSSHLGAGARQTLVWNGPLGAFEIEPFDAGTVAVARSGRGTHRRPASSSRSRAAATPWRRWTRAGVDGQFHLCLDRRRRLPRMDGRQDPARRRGAQGQITVASTVSSRWIIWPRKARQKTNARSLTIKKDYPILQVAVRRLRGRRLGFRRFQVLPRTCGPPCGRVQVRKTRARASRAAGNFDRSGARRAQDGCARQLYRHAATTFGRAAGRCAPRPCPALRRRMYGRSHFKGGASSHTVPCRRTRASAYGRHGRPTNATFGLVSCPMQNAPILLAETELTFFVLPPVQLCAS